MRLSIPVLLRAGFGASLALNLVLGGLLLFRDPGGGPADPRRLVAHMERLLPPGDREVFHARMEMGWETRDAARRRLRKAFAEVRASIGREPFDPAALQAALAATRTEGAGFGQSFDTNLVQAMGAISPEGRRRIAEDMPPGRSPGRRGRDAGGHGPGDRAGDRAGDGPGDQDD